MTTLAGRSASSRAEAATAPPADAPASPHRRVAALVLAVVLAMLVGSFWAAAPASAHAVLVTSTPVDGSRVATSPATVHLVFDEHIQIVPGAVKILSTTGVRADTGHVRLDAKGVGILIGVKPRLARGTYTVTWRVVSADTHVVSGSIVFGVDQSPTASAAASGTPPGTALDVVANLAQGAVYVGVILCFGVPLVALLLWPAVARSRRVRVMTITGWGMLLTGTLSALLLQGPRATQTGWAGVARLDDLSQTVHGADGATLIVRLALLVALLLSAHPTERLREQGVAGAAALGVLVTIALGGHAAVGTDVAVAVPMAVLHLCAMTLWAGGLAVLLVAVLPHTGADDIVGSLRRWSTLAFVCVGVLIVTGEYQAWRQIAPVPALWSTPYGVTLLVKLTLVAGALAAAVLAHRVLYRRAARTAGRPSAVLRRIRRSVVIESALVACVVAVTAVLVAEPPASTTYGPPARVTASLGSAGHVDISVDTTRRGPQTLTVTPVRPDGERLPVRALAVTLSTPGVAALDQRVQRRTDGTWRTLDTTVPLPGTWTITLDVSLTGSLGYATRTTYTVW